MASTAKGQPLGLATLDSSAKLASAQLPDGIAVVDTGAAVADQAALTTSAPAALTTSAAAALTSAAATGGDSPTEAEYNALRVDLVEVRTKFNAAVVDLTEVRTQLAAAVVDLTAERTKMNALLASLRAANLIDT